MFPLSQRRALSLSPGRAVLRLTWIIIQQCPQGITLSPDRSLVSIQIWEENTVEPAHLATGRSLFLGSVLWMSRQSSVWTSVLTKGILMLTTRKKGSPDFDFVGLYSGRGDLFCGAIDCQPCRSRGCRSGPRPWRRVQPRGEKQAGKEIAEKGSKSL